MNETKRFGILHFALAAVVAIGFVGYIIAASSDVDSVTAQEDAAPTATSTPAAETVVVEVCSVDRESGKITCVEKTEVDTQIEEEEEGATGQGCDHFGGEQTCYTEISISDDLDDPLRRQRRFHRYG